MPSYAKSLTVFTGSWLTVSTIFLAGEIAYRYGAIAGIFTMLAFVVAFLLSIVFLRRDIAFERTPFLFNVIQLLYLVRNSMILFLILYFLANVFQVHQINFTVISIVSSIVLYFLYRRWDEWGLSVRTANTVLIFSLAIFLPSYLYLQLGFETVYHNLQHYYPRMLYTSLEGKWQVFLLLALIFFLYFFSQLNYVKLFVQSDFHRGLRKLLIGVLIIGMALLSFSTMTIVALTKDIQTDHINEILLAVIQSQSPVMLSVIIFLLIYIVTLIELYISLAIFETEALFPAKYKAKIMVITVIVGSLASYILIHLGIPISVLSLFIYYGIIIEIGRAS